MRTFEPRRHTQFMIVQRRRLPHLYPLHKPLFVTWHLYGSLPAGRYPPPHCGASGQAFVWIDRYLDRTRTGPMFLRQPEVAKVVVAAIRRGDQELGHYELHAYVLMANHVHLLIVPKIAPRQLLRALKGSTAREANRILGRTGKPFWQRESYDHWVRNESEWVSIRAYIERNPVTAGLAANPEDYPWSSAATIGGKSAAVAR
jgi:putative transposase